MKELIVFSLKRKYFNPVMMIMNILLIIAIGSGFHADKLINLINPTLFEPVEIGVDSSMFELLTYMQDYEKDFIFKEKFKEEIKENEYLLTQTEMSWQIHSFYPLDMAKMNKLQDHLNVANQKNGKPPIL